MAFIDEEPLKRARAHEIGQDLSLLSVDELHARIEVLKQEIARLEQELSQKGATKAAADALFRS
ncbi:DUF1192 domain-containing protein [Mesorhizobium sp. Z1-4]|uniref:DUF1192 domain-containing protein n=1 Tax=Mesorhizobium sp. Z1-4 TaxID=2448478 RepID=UPI000FDB28DD|nr:DUF1192 domain-containing protein [Mesorhizobium sp. Z1-4]